MMEYKVVISDSKAGKSYQVEVKDEQAKKLRGLKMGDEFEGVIVGAPGYKMRITGGSDRGGFPMRKGVHTQGAKKILSADGVGFKAKRGERKRVRVHGEIVGDDIVQVNTSITGYGSKPITEILGLDKKSEDASENSGGSN
jgi:small subunit ribosomal protein S6e